MNRTANLLGLALTLAPTAIAASGPLKVTAVASPKPHFAGQGIVVGVEVDPASGLPAVEPPRPKDAEVFPIPADPARPATARFVVVPGRAGPLDLPAFRVRSGDRSGASRPTRLVVAGVPTEGRPPAFLGGVGPFEVRAEAGSKTVRAGETLEVRVNISGPAAWGSSRPPDPGGWASPTLKVQPGGDQLRAGESPVRTFRYRLRPLKSGKVTLHPVAVAAFDPTTRRFATRTTSSLTIEVEEPPRFDPSRLGDSPAARPSPGPRAGRVALAVVTSIVVAGSSLAAWFAARRGRRPRAVDPQKLALDLSNALSDEGDEAEAARAVAEALTTFLHRAGGRAPGVLTPPEARAGFGRWADDPTIASLAEALMTRCDRARYGSTGGEGRALISEGRRFFEGLAGSMAGGGR